MRVDELETKSGFFWLVGNSDNKIPGTLTVFDGGKFQLEVVGDFEPNRNPFDIQNELGRIIGHVESDGYVTLERCFITQSQSTFGGISKSLIQGHMLLSGAAYEPDETVTFQSLSFSIECLEEWLGLTGINVTSDRQHLTSTIEYKPLDSLTFDLDNGLTLEICFGYTLPGQPAITEAKITHRAYFKLTANEPLLLDELLTVAHRINTFMCFVTDETVSMSKVSGMTPDITREYSKGDHHQVPIRILFQSVIYSNERPIKQWHRMNFQYSLIKDQFQSIINKWLHSYETIKPALNLYFSTKVGAQKYLDGKFLALAQCLETYHRRTNNDSQMPQEIYDDLISTLKEACPDEHLDWFNGRLSFGNELSLRRRLKDVASPFKAFFGNKSSRIDFINSIVDTRNYLTHYNADLKAKSATGTKLLNTCYKMELLFELQMLKQIGLTHAQIDNILDCSPRLKSKLDIAKAR